MEYLLERLKNDIAKIQATIKREGETLVQKIQELDLTKNFHEKKKQLEKMALANFKKIEPLCQKITTDFANKVKKAALDLNHLEEKLRRATDTARMSLQNPNRMKKKVVSDLKKTEKTVKRAVSQTQRRVKRAEKDVLKAVGQTQRTVKKAVKKQVKTASSQLKKTVKKMQKKAVKKKPVSKKRVVKKKVTKKVTKKKVSKKR